MSNRRKIRPDWGIAIVDGEPVQTINAAAVAELIRLSPLGRDEALRRMLAGSPPEAAAALLAALADQSTSDGV